MCPPLLFLSLYYCANAASQRFSALPKFHGYLCETELLLQLLPPPSSFSLPVRAQWWDEQEGIEAFIITAIKTLKDIQECHTSDTPFLLLLMSLPNRRARLSCEEERRDAAGHLIAVAKAAFLFAQLVPRKTFARHTAFRGFLQHSGVKTTGQKRLIHLLNWTLQKDSGEIHQWKTEANCCGLLLLSDNY